MSAIRETLVLLRIALSSWAGVVILEAVGCGVAATLSVTTLIWSPLPMWVSVVEALLSLVSIGLIAWTLTIVARRSAEHEPQKKVIEDLLRGAELHDREQNATRDE